ncbi:MAG: hypothetical protein HRU46_01650 [Verrucomicrobiales bacterium]|nr:hypothetical protein [Verrucomicrobiales bacterium]
MERSEIMGRYQHYVLEHGTPPPSVYAFAKGLEIGEREFFEQFGSFEALESDLWETTVCETLEAVRSGEDWTGFNAHQCLLTFLYAYCDRILDQRSFFLARFPRWKKSSGQPPEGLCGMRSAFTEFADEILEKGMANGEIACRGAMTRTYPLGLFGHFLSVVEFNLADDSSGFERTDAYIEKSVRLAFDVIGTQAVDSAFDLFRFLSGRSWAKAD